MMGVAMALSLYSLRESMGTGAMLYKVSRRSAILFALGLLVNGNYDFHSFRVMGVLQVRPLYVFFVLLDLLTSRC